jgi:predicted nucleic acid-binding Zn ribbon protein
LIGSSICEDQRSKIGVGQRAIVDSEVRTMPLYVYEVVLPGGSAGETFEVLQNMADPPLTEHPETGEPVRRVFGTPNAPKGWTDAHGKAKLSDKSLERMGFTKYVKSDKGKYEKVVGKGPGTITRPPAN